MDDIGSSVGLRPALYCLVIQHVFMAAIILATDVLFDPTSPQAQIRKTEVLATCDMLEVSKRESVMAREYIDSHIRKLRSLLKPSSMPQPQTGMGTASATTRPEDTGQMTGAFAAPGPIHSPSHMKVHELRVTPGGNSTSHGLSQDNSSSTSHQTMSAVYTDGVDLQLDSASNISPPVEDSDMSNWDQIWADFFAAAPELDMPQWHMLFDSMDSGLGSTSHQQL